MKKNLIAIPFLLGALALAALPALSLANMPAVETRAEPSNYAKASLPTTIDLNPVPEADLRSYYAPLESLPAEERSGVNLLKNLKPILSAGQQYFSYDIGKGADIWKAYEITDRDWTLSPAMKITSGSYDAATNKITDYKYGSSDNPYIHTLYRNLGVEEARQRVLDDHGKDGGYDREHIWPKSRGFGMMPDKTEFTAPGARGDLMHLLPGDHPVNSYAHKNYSYGFVDRAKVDKDMGQEYKLGDVVTLAGNYLGVSASLGQGKVFEPQDSDKGDIARAVFYMAARYNNYAKDDDTIDGGNPNLFLDETTSEETVYSTKDSPVSIGVLRDLLTWHHLDPVDEYEIRRNDIVYRNFNHNRNPFVDFPQWADFVWGTTVYDESAHKTASYSPTPTGMASPSVDNVHSFKPLSPIASIALKEGYKTEYAYGESFVKPTILGTAEDGSVREVTASCSFSGFDANRPGKQTIEVAYGETLRLTYNIVVAEKPATPWYVYALLAAGVVVVVIVVIVAATSKGKAGKKARKVIAKATRSPGAKRKSSRPKAKKK